MKQCEDCPEPALAGWRFCKACKKRRLAEMREERYLTPRCFGHVGASRTNEKKEIVRETKFGTGHG
jgi:hypothetical protein